MSKSGRKRRLIQEAIREFKQVRHSEKSWEHILADRLRHYGWDVSHPGADKFIAIKGPLVCKWIGERGWSDNAIKDMMGIRRALKKAGLKRFLPRMYVCLGDEFMIEQLCKVNKDFSRTTVTCEDYAEVVSTLGDICITDLCEKNMGKVNNRQKVIDGRIHC